MFILIVAVSGWARVHAQDPPPSWNEGAARQTILAFVESVTTERSPGFVPSEERIVTFDQDGTLWVKQHSNCQYEEAIQSIVS